MKEEWRPIPDYEDLYEVSNKGRVRSKPREIKIVRYNDDGVQNFYSVRKSIELKPYRQCKTTGEIVYHLHRRYKSGYYGQTDTYHHVNDLVRLAFPELYANES